MFRRAAKAIFDNPVVKQPVVDMKRSIGTTIRIKQALENSEHFEVVADSATRLQNGALLTMQDILKNKYNTESKYTGDCLEVTNGNLHDLVNAQAEAEAKSTRVESYLGGDGERYVKVESLDMDVLRAVRSEMAKKEIHSYISRHANTHFVLTANSSKPNFAEDTLKDLSEYCVRFK